MENGDDAVLFGEDKRRFLATVQTFMRKCFVYILLLQVKLMSV